MLHNQDQPGINENLSQPHTPPSPPPPNYSDFSRLFYFLGVNKWSSSLDLSKCSYWSTSECNLTVSAVGQGANDQIYLSTHPLLS